MSKQESPELWTGTWPTAWGPMGALGGPAGLRRLILPHYEPQALRDLLAWEHPDAAVNDAGFADLAELCRDFFKGLPVDFAAIVCDLPGMGPFGRKVLQTCRTVAYGRTVTYTQLAALAGEEGKPRPVATALAKNPVPLVIPCHRVLGVGGRLSGFTAPGGTDLKRRLLELEARVGSG